ncbi:divergent polysaccharide deacetylase family protein [Dongia deserti]|uniref:divergent polysaccharide deacetylase family protein n=1 Tax=Dongia deserti TaxID=2268030 RepID=UPI0013C42172|nr:divergent polysaccharide deacetylase family protein [Dongia deserti]
MAIEEDLSPAELLAKYPPDPSDALPTGAQDLPAWQRFGRTSMISPEARRVALIITGLGRNRTDTVRAITGAPPEASLSFDPDVPELADWIAAARAYGHEVFLDLPLSETARADALAPEQKPEDNVQRLDAMLARAPMIAGVVMRGSEAFLADGAALQPILKHLQAAGLAIVGLPVTAPLTVGADEVIAPEETQREIARAIDSVMGLARHRGAALGLVDSSSAASLFPAWQRALVGRDEISLVPASAVVGE